MINLNPFQNSSTEFLSEVVSSKNKRKDEIPPFYKDRVIALSKMMLPAYQSYDAAFLKNELHTVTASVRFTADQKSDVLNLYNYNSKPFTKLKNKIISRPNDHEVHTCQYCTISSINTLDHIIPKESYPEFVVHPKNLFPACSQCNSYKSTKWMTDGIFEFLNPYLHHLPTEQFLFVNVDYINNTFNIDFYLDNSDNLIPSYLFDVIKNHYRNLHLLKRFKNESYKIISEFDNSIQGSLTTQSLNNALNSARASISFNQNTFGFNQFENILKLELCNGVAFRKYCQTQGY
ncbi:HNH endonuclease [Psychrobacter faecalis]|uniref:HNH endonuclease n=1 Tax=Psychrobacter faecalis TaxID=180588 RepID=A0ABT9HFJ2_9GAMM|nr:HNH endonuclease [Psychrobacter faecalis]MDP4544541.1 HNH endonuclease [Psychrobacter faecalis]